MKIFVGYVSTEEDGEALDFRTRACSCKRNVHGLDQPLTQSPIRERAGPTRPPHSLLADGEGDPEVLRTLLE